MDFVIVDSKGQRTLHPPFRAAENAWSMADRLNNLHRQVGPNGLTSRRGPFTVELQNSPSDDLPLVGG